jgi:hypothetical protein
MVRTSQGPNPGRLVELEKLARLPRINFNRPQDNVWARSKALKMNIKA